MRSRSSRRSCSSTTASAPSVPPEVLVPAEIADTAALREFLTRAARLAGRGARAAARREAAARRARRRERPARARGGHRDPRGGSVEADRSARGAARGAQPREPAAADRVLRRLEHPGRVDRRVDDRLRRRAGAKNAHYRTFAIRGLDGQDDVGAMREAVSRRFARLREGDRDESFSRMPNLVVVDGGKGQLGRSARGDRGARPAARRGHLAREARGGGLRPGASRCRSCSSARARRSSSSSGSATRRIGSRSATTGASAGRARWRRSSRRLPGVGPVRRRAIIRHFGSVERFLEASQEELEGVPGPTAEDGARALRAAPQGRSLLGSSRPASSCRSCRAPCVKRTVRSVERDRGEAGDDVRRRVSVSSRPTLNASSIERGRDAAQDVEQERLLGPDAGRRDREERRDALRHLHEAGVLERLRDVERVEQEPDRRRGGGPSRPPARSRRAGGSASAADRPRTPARRARGSSRRARRSRSRGRRARSTIAASERSSERAGARGSRRSRSSRARASTSRPGSALEARAPRRGRALAANMSKKLRTSVLETTVVYVLPGIARCASTMRTASPARARDDRVDPDACEVGGVDRAPRDALVGVRGGEHVPPGPARARHLQRGGERWRERAGSGLDRPELVEERIDPVEDAESICWSKHGRTAAVLADSARPEVPRERCSRSCALRRLPPGTGSGSRSAGRRSP